MTYPNNCTQTSKHDAEPFLPLVHDPYYIKRPSGLDTLFNEMSMELMWLIMKSIEVYTSLPASQAFKSWLELHSTFVAQRPVGWDTLGWTI